MFLLYARWSKDDFFQLIVYSHMVCGNSRDVYTDNVFYSGTENLVIHFLLCNGWVIVNKLQRLSGKQQQNSEKWAFGWQNSIHYSEPDLRFKLKHIICYDWNTRVNYINVDRLTGSGEELCCKPFTLLLAINTSVTHWWVRDLFFISFLQRMAGHRKSNKIDFLRHQ